MHAIGKVFIDVIVIMFFVGLAGSAVVVLISFVEDFKELFGDDDAIPEATPHSPAKTTSSAAAALSYSGEKPRLSL